MNQIYINGCSFTRDIHVSYELGHKLYSDYLSDHYTIPVINHGLPGSCNRRIIRSTLRDVLNYDSRTFVIVQLTFLERFQKSAEKNHWQFGDLFVSENKEILQSIKAFDPNNTDIENQYIEMILKNNSSAVLFDELMIDILMLTYVLKSKNIPYLIYIHPNIIDHSQVHESDFYKLVSNDPSVKLEPMSHLLNAQNYYYDGLYNHLNQSGHKKLSELLINLINSTNKRN